MNITSIKKTLSLLLVLAALSTLTACAGKPAQNVTVLHVGIVQLVDNGAFTDMREGFIARMRELGYSEDKMTFSYQNAQGDMSNLNSICQNMASENLDVIVTIATPPTQAMVNLAPKAPIFFIAVSNPVAAGVITDMAKPDKNATGTSNAIPVDEMFKLAAQVTPNVTSFGLLYNAGEVNSVSTVTAAKAYLEQTGSYTYEEAVVTASSEVQQAAQALAEKVDAIFVPNDSMIQSALTQVVEVANAAGVPVYGSSAVMVNTGAFATISIDDTVIGARTADMVHSYLGGTAVADIPAVVISDFVTLFHQGTADAIGIKIPDSMLQNAVIVK
ncbi:MAG: ABC transporter substrate-binding protein [Christensenellaceae bacterium]|jgi:putative ABC transport system substrate-binding protein|nr:ABC transporter substrate-binding protein [Christensenellaceae bacterium]